MDDFDLSGMGESSRQSNQWPEPARMALGCGSGCALLVLLEFAAIWLFVTFMMNARPPEGLVAKVAAPLKSTVGKSFPLKVTVRNQGSRAFTVRSISARTETLRRFKLDTAKPAPMAGKTSLFGTDTWAYNHTIRPNETWTVTFQATPQQAGELRGSVDIQVNSAMSSAPFTTTAAEESASKPTR